MAGHSTEIANEFLKRAQASSLPLTQMQLQKLVYLSQGWSLAVLDQPLVTDQVRAWEYGPVYPDLYTALRRYGAKPVNKLINYQDFLPYSPSNDGVAFAVLEQEETDVLDEVFKIYGKYPAFKLSALTHEDGTPWQLIYNPNRTNSGIPDELIREYFLRFINAAH